MSTQENIDNDRRDYTMLLKYLESEFAHVKEKIDLVQLEQKATRKELNDLKEELQAHYNDEYPHKICKTNSERIKRLDIAFQEYMEMQNSEKTHNAGVKKGVYLSAKVIKYILLGSGGLLLYFLDVFTKIKGLFL